MKINCIIVDDESLARKGLNEYTKSIDFLNVVGVCKNAMEADAILRKEQVDLLFLDIEMPLISGMDFLKTLPHPPKVIFTTAYSEYALDSFAFDVIDYLVKPISFERFLKAANKAYKVFSDKKQEAVPESNDRQNYFFAKVDKEFVKIKYHEILYIQGMQNYVNIVCEGHTKMVLIPLKNVFGSLPEDQFLQVHRSFIVNKEKIEAISGNQLLIKDDKIPLSRHLKESVVDELTKNKILKK